MNHSYYQTLITELKQMIEEKAYRLAQQRIEEELKMPYVPKESLRVLTELKLELKALLPVSVAQTESDESILESYIQGSESLQLKLLDSLSHLNARNYLSLIQKALNELSDPLMKALLIRILIEQALPDSFSVEISGIHYDFIPASLILPEESDGFNSALALLNLWCEKEPSLFELSLATLSLKCLNFLPNAYEQDEGDALALSALKEVYLSLYDEGAFKNFCREKKIEGISLALLN